MIDRVVEIWLKSEFAGGRHKRRNDKIADLERKQIEKNTRSKE